MRIALVLGSSNVGGTELNTLRTATSLLRRGHDVTQILIGKPGTLVNRFADTGVRLVQVPSRSLAHPQILGTLRDVTQALLEAKVQVVHTQDVFANIIGVPAGRLARTPAIVSSRRWWKATPRRVHRSLNRVAYALSHGTVANAQSVAAMLIQDERLSGDRVSVIPNLIDGDLLTEQPTITRTVAREILGIAPDAILVMCVARLMPVKNHAMLISAFATLTTSNRGLRLVLIGNGDLKQALEKQVNDLGIADSVTFAGEREGAARLYRAADIAALTSLSEGMPNSLLEAMACGLPVVSTAVGGSVDIVREGITGLLVPSGDHGALADALASLVASPPRRVEMGLAGKEMVLRTHTENSVIPQLEDLYTRLLSRRRH